MATIEERAHEAAIKFFQNRGYEIIQEGFKYPGFDVDLVVYDPDGVLVFVVEKIKDKESTCGNRSLTIEERTNYVHMMLAFLDEHKDIIDAPVRLDYFGLYPMGDRALIEHHIGAAD